MPHPIGWLTHMAAQFTGPIWQSTGGWLPAIWITITAAHVGFLRLTRHEDTFARVSRRCEWLFPLKHRWAVLGLTLFSQVILSPVLGFVWGAMLLTTFAVLTYELMDPTAVGGGQWGMLFVFTVPLGGMIGAFGYTVGSLVLSRRIGLAGWLAISGGVFLTLLMLYESSGSFSDRLINLIELPGIGSPMAFALTIAVWGVVLLWRHRRQVALH